MLPFRNHTPKRRNITRKVATHRDHKDDLRTDFTSRCGYCNYPEAWTKWYYEVDHFIPDSILTIKTSTDYTNLVFACRSCNNAKRKKWPTGDQNIANANDEGFIDPCDDTYNDHFYRKNNGEIGYNTNLGNWIYTNLKFNKPQHQIVWNIEEAEKAIDEIKKLADKLQLTLELKDMLENTFKKYHDYIEQWKKIR